jgi:glutathione S-transferase
MGPLTLIQIPFSHNCVKVRVALARKGLSYETRNIPPPDRASVFAASGQGLVPVLIDDGRVLFDSTAILLHLEEHYPDPPLVPKDPALRAECLLLEDWADQAFMALSRRVSYANVFKRPGALTRMFFPEAKGLNAWVKERMARRVVTKRFHISPRRYVTDVAEAKRLAALAMARLDGRRWLVGDTATIADIALATMPAPLLADPVATSDDAVRALLAWGEALLPADVAARYRGGTPQA